MTSPPSLAAHYRHGSLMASVDAALAAAGKTGPLQPADLAAVDEWHSGGRAATIAVARALAPHAEARWLDIGSGLGGASRYFADTHGCEVVGIDMTQEFVAVATALAERVGLAGRVTYAQTDALALPFGAGEFDGAYMLHVGMNIADKAALAASVRRVLRPGAAFAVYDVMRVGAGEFGYPVPWASSPEHSFVATPAEYRAALKSGGFAVESEQSLRELALDGFARARAAGPSPLGLHLVMGTETSAKVRNMVAAVSSGALAPVLIVARAV